MTWRSKAGTLVLGLVSLLVAEPAWAQGFTEAFKQGKVLFAQAEEQRTEAQRLRRVGETQKADVLMSAAVDGYRKANAAFSAAFAERPDDPDTNFYLGRTAFEFGDFEAPVMAFERVLIAVPESDDPGDQLMRNRAKLELARSYFMLGVHDMAKLYFEQVLASNPPEEVRRSIGSFVQRIERANQTQFFGGVLTLGTHWDTNINVSPQNTSITIPAFPGPVNVDEEDADGFMSATLAVNHRAKLGDNGFEWKTAASAYNAFYKQDVDLDLNYLSLATGPGISGQKQSVGVQAVYEALNKDYERNLRSVGLQLSLFRQLSPGLAANVSARVVDKQYRTAPKREAANGSLTLGAVYAWGRNRLTASGAFERENAQADADFEEDENSYDKYSGTLRYERRFPRNISCFANYKYEFVDYSVRETVFNTIRHDDIHEATVGVNKRLENGMVVELSHAHTRSYSSIELYRYHRHVTALTLTLNF